MADSLARVAQEIRSCTRCRLSLTRTRAVPGEGVPEAPLLLVGEAPGATEDRTGRPFQGAAGNFLTAALEDLGLRRKQVYLAAVVRCRPPRNRVPRGDEADACAGYLDRQITLVAPRVVLALGLTAAVRLHPDLPAGAARVADLRGQPIPMAEDRVLLVTYHPAAAMRFPQHRQPFVDDLAVASRLAGYAGV